MLLRCVEGLLQFGDIVIKQLEIIGDFFFPADRRHEDDDLRAGVAGDGVGSFEVEVRLNKNKLYAVALHLANHLDGVLRARVDEWARFVVFDYYLLHAFWVTRIRVSRYYFQTGD